MIFYLCLLLYIRARRILFSSFLSSPFPRYHSFFSRTHLLYLTHTYHCRFHLPHTYFSPSHFNHYHLLFLSRSLLLPISFPLPPPFLSLLSHITPPRPLAPLKMDSFTRISMVAGCLGDSGLESIGSVAANFSRTEEQEEAAEFLRYSHGSAMVSLFLVFSLSSF